MRNRLDPFAPCALLAQGLLAVRLQTTAWPEVTTPGYLISRGWVLYRDIGFVHTPGLMEMLGGFFWMLGTSAWVVKAFALLWPLIAHAFLLAETRHDRLPVRAAASAFFLAVFYSWGGNAIWPPVMIAALAIPIASALARGRMKTAGLSIGLAILIKQTAAYLLLFVLLRLVLRRRLRDAAAVGALASAPYLAAGAVFALVGSGRAFVLWTLAAPFQWLYETIPVAPNAFAAFTLVLAFVPIAIQTLRERGEGSGEATTGWYLLTAVGLACMAYPRFGLLQAAGAVPCLAVGAARLLRRPARLGNRALEYALVGGIALSTLPILLASNRLDGVVVFWNDEPALERLVGRLRELPPETRVHSEIWENVLPQSRRVPPGRFYAHPWLMPFLARVDSMAARVNAAAAMPGTLTVRFGAGERRGGSTVGPYLLETR